MFREHLEDATGNALGNASGNALGNDPSERLVEILCDTYLGPCQTSIIPVGIYLLKLNNRNTRTRCEICSKLTMELIPCSSVSIVNFENLIAGWDESFFQIVHGF